MESKYDFSGELNVFNLAITVQIHLKNWMQYKYKKMGVGVAKLVARPPTDPKVRGSNHRGPEYL
jgi:hypothetical protein